MHKWYIAINRNNIRMKKKQPDFKKKSLKYVSINYREIKICAQLENRSIIIINVLEIFIDIHLLIM